MYKTGHAFNYLLHKENVANDVINVSLFAYDEITLKTLRQKPEKMYKTGHAFNYLLHKENVANDVINVSLFAYDEITLKT